MTMIANDTQVFVEGDSVIVVPPNVEYLPPESAKKINQVVSIDVHFRVDEIIKADILLFLSPIFPIEASPEYHYLDPVTSRKIKRIEFEDGSVWEEKVA